MLKSLIYLCLGLVLWPAAGFARAKTPAYDPVSATASMDARIASWELLRIRSPYDGGEAIVGHQFLSASGQGRYYEEAGADQAVEYYQASKKAQLKGILWIAISPGVGAVVGGLSGLIAADQRVHDAGYEEDWGALGYLILGVVGGAVAGVAVGGIGAISEHVEMTDARKKAAESFNQKLLKDLNLSVEPSPRGALLDIQKKF
jgi:hypothetical protein